MALTQNVPGPHPAPAPTGPSVRVLRKGELLFAEGENSRAMYFLKSGMIRLFKKKGDALIELDTVHSGQVLGELAFLDGNPRSASGEALTDCELVEISGPTFTQTLGSMPDWLKILLKTVVGRLRAASTRIRQLETASTAVDYSDKSGRRSANYVYLSPTDVLKALSAILLVASRPARSGESGSGLPELRISLYHRYANQIMGIPVAKLATFQDLLTQVGLLTVAEEPGSTRVYVRDPEFLEQMIAFINEQNLCEPTRRHDLTPRGFVLMGLIQKHLPLFRKDGPPLTVVNLAKIQEIESASGKDLVRLDDFTQLATFGYASLLNIQSSTEILTTIDADAFTKAYRIQRVMIGIQAVNEQKRKQTASIK